MKSGIDRAVEQAGSQAKLAALLGVSGAAVCRWVRRGWVSPERARHLERELGIPRKEFIDPRLLALVDG